MGEERTNWLGRLAAKLFKEKPPPLSLLVEDSGFSYMRQNGKTTVCWSDVKEVFAFKRDLFTVDLICIGFRISDDGSYYEINEEMNGYKEVMATMEKAFPRLTPDWWSKIAFPAFATNLTTLWGESKMAAIWKA